ncbi:hypothetical protein LXA43DRAFT_1089886 [Ganoderma leucocontextum]|nr:hypothetical protein LXA43DRAFT_1089886 [Ganoderma leucocontextum]
MTSSSLGAPSLGNTFGVLLLSTFVSLMLYGLTLAQTIRYARLYPSDRPFLKILVAAIFIADTLHSASMVHICYHYLVTNYLAPAVLSENVWSVHSLLNTFVPRYSPTVHRKLLPLSTGVTVLLTQGFYMRRIYIVSYRYRFVVLVIVVLLLGEFGFMTASSVVSFQNRTFDAIYGYIWMDTVLFAIATVVDLVLTSAFVVILNRSRTGFLGTDSALDILARYALYATGLISALTVPAFICSLALSRTFVYFAIAISAVKVYSNSVLAVLNCRKSLLLNWC